MANRIETLLEAHGMTAAKSAAQGVFCSDDEASCTYFAPLHYEPNYAYPLLVWLHGPEGDESQLPKIMPHISMRNYVAVGPRGTLKSAKPLARRAYSWSQSTGHIPLAEQAILDAIERASSRYNVAANRVFIAGYDSGGTMALRTALNHPERFAGVLSLGGPLPSRGAPFAQLQAVRRVPVFVACGRYAQRYQSQQVCDNLKLLHTAGMSLTVRQYPCGDEITTQMLTDMDRWIMEQVLPAAPDSQSEVEHEHGEWS